MANDINYKIRHDVIEAVKQFTEKHNYCPTLDEIADMVGIKAKSYAKKLVDEIKSDGVLDYVPGSPRTIHIVPDDFCWACGNENEKRMEVSLCEYCRDMLQ